MQPTPKVDLAADWPTWPVLATHGQDIADWAASVPNPRLVVLDTLAGVRPPKQNGEALYDADYRALVALHRLAGEKGFAVLVLHHTRKAEADDPLDVKRHLASQRVYGGGKRPFGFDVVNDRLVPNANEQTASARMKALRAKGKPLREISKAIASEFHVEMPATSIKRILDRYVDARQMATLQCVGRSVSFPTLQEAVIARDSLPTEEKADATIKVTGPNERVYSSGEIDLLHHA